MALKQLRLVAKIEQDKEDQLMQELQTANKFLLDNQDKLANIYDYRKEYMQELTNRGQGGMDGNAFAQFNAFVNKLDSVVEQQLKVIDTAKQVVEQKRQFLAEQQQKRKAVNMLIEKYVAKEKQIEEKKEQKLLDELSTQNFFRRRDS